MNYHAYGCGVFTLHPILSETECISLIDKGNTIGFIPAMINNGGVRQFSTMRNNESVVFNDSVFAEQLWEKIKPYITDMANMTPYGVDDLFRMYRYTEGQKFDKHIDGATKKPNGDRSLLTFIIYLNDSYEGGETGFDFKAIKGSTGMGLIFPHKLLHSGDVVKSGVKYAIRTDIMFKFL